METVLRRSLSRNITAPKMQVLFAPKLITPNLVVQTTLQKIPPWVLCWRAEFSPEFYPKSASTTIYKAEQLTVAHDGFLWPSCGFGLSAKYLTGILPVGISFHWQEYYKEDLSRRPSGDPKFPPEELPLSLLTEKPKGYLICRNSRADKFSRIFA